MDLISSIEKEQLKEDIPEFAVGDSVRVHLKITEGARERTQAFEGTVIRKRGGGLRQTFTVRRISFGVGVEKTFPIHSPVIQRVEVVDQGIVRRAKLYYLRDRAGKKGRVKRKWHDKQSN